MSEAPQPPASPPAADTPPEPTLPRFARDRTFGAIAALAGAVAWVASAILVLERLELYKDPGYITSCDLNPWVSCGTVMRSWQAALFGFPNPLIGIVGFAIVITVGMALLSGARFARWYWIGFQTGITLAFVFVVWLWSQAVYDINALCIYCMVVWLATVPLFVYTTARNIVHGVVPAPAALRNAAAEYPLMLTVGLLVLLALTIVLRFWNAFFG